MFPEIRHNDYVIISKFYDYEALDDKIVAVQLEGANTLKTLHVDNARQQSLFYPVNRRHKPIICDSDAPGNPVILGIMVMLYRFYI
jgi:SOS-response transcriptional repressor LexA